MIVNVSLIQLAIRKLFRLNILNFKLYKTIFYGFNKKD